MAHAKVAVLITRAESVLEDYGRLMRLVDYSSHLPKDKTTQLKINISWHFYYPACSTAPWQLEGVAKTLLDDIPEPSTAHCCESLCSTIKLIRQFYGRLHDFGQRGHRKPIFTGFCGPVKQIPCQLSQETWVSIS